MQVVSSTEFATHQQKYFEQALNEQVFVKNGNYTFRIMYEPIVEEQVILQPDDKLRRAITGDQLLAGIYQDLETFYASR
jgi:hypothetical protein